MKHRLAAIFISLAAAALPFQAGAAKNAGAPVFADAPAVREFIAEMHVRYGFDAAYLTRQFASIRSNPAVLRAIQPAAVPELHAWPCFAPTVPLSLPMQRWRQRWASRAARWRASIFAPSLPTPRSFAMH